jgi:hypothetical protein
MLVVGFASFAIAPLEVVCYEWFAEGGRFGYEGFGFGSFVFAYLTAQIAGYYLIAAVLLPLGLGHLTRRAWVAPVMESLAWCWVVVGAPLTLVVFLVLLMAKDLTPLVVIGAGLLAILSYVALPGLIVRFYRSSGARQVLGIGGLGAASASSRGSALGLGVPALVVAMLQAFLGAALSLLMLVRGLFPVLHGWATGLPGLALVDVALVGIALLLYGTLRRRRWAWPGTLLYFGGMWVLWVATLVGTSWAELLDILAFPPTEIAFLDGIPAQGWHLAILVGLPLTGMCIATLRARWFASPNDEL